MNTKILELENMIESDFNPELFEKKHMKFLGN